MTFNPALIPAVLQQTQGWILWMYEWRERWVKPPCGPNGARLPGWQRPSSRLSFRYAVELARTGSPHGVGGVGFVFTPQTPFVGIDIDHCRDRATGEIAPDIVQVLEGLGTYAEVSPSGTGIHIIGRVDNKAELVKLVERHGVKHGTLDIFVAGRFLTMTGKVLPGYTEIRDITAALLLIISNNDSATPASAGGSAEEQVPGPVKEPEPPPEEIASALAAVCGRLPQRRRDLLDGRVLAGDRSESAAELTHLLVEAGVSAPRMLAVIVFGSGIHRAKFAGRRDGWTDALRLAGRVLDEHAVVQLPAGTAGKSPAKPVSATEELTRPASYRRLGCA